MHFLPEKLDHYITEHTQQEPEHLKELTRETFQKVMQPRMLSGAYQGRVLSLISKLTNPKNILEIGTFTGYATLCLAEGLQPQGTLHTIDCNEELYDLQKRHFNKSKYSHQITQHLGNALTIIPKMDTLFDLVFIDADKENYVNYFNLIIDKLNPKAVIISDNVLWNGKVIETVNSNDKTTETLLKYNKLLNNDHRIETVMLPIRDGLSISRKK